MKRCSEERPQLVQLHGSDREVACWLHSGGRVVPAELDQPDPASKKPARLETVRQVSEL
jgi:hypothetical protein